MEKSPEAAHGIEQRLNHGQRELWCVVQAFAALEQPASLSADPDAPCNWVSLQTPAGQLTARELVERVSSGDHEVLPSMTDDACVSFTLRSAAPYDALRHAKIYPDEARFRKKFPARLVADGYIIRNGVLMEAARSTGLEAVSGLQIAVNSSQQNPLILLADTVSSAKNPLVVTGRTTRVIRTNGAYERKALRKKLRGLDGMMGNPKALERLQTALRGLDSLTVTQLRRLLEAQTANDAYALISAWGQPELVKQLESLGEACAHRSVGWKAFAAEASRIGIYPRTDDRKAHARTALTTSTLSRVYSLGEGLAERKRKRRLLIAAVAIGGPAALTGAATYQFLTTRAPPAVVEEFVGQADATPTRPRATHTPDRPAYSTATPDSTDPKLEKRYAAHDAWKAITRDTHYPFLDAQVVRPELGEREPLFDYDGMMQAAFGDGQTHGFLATHNSLDETGSYLEDHGSWQLQITTERDAKGAYLVHVFELDKTKGGELIPPPYFPTTFRYDPVGYTCQALDFYGKVRSERQFAPRTYADRAKQDCLAVYDSRRLVVVGFDHNPDDGSVIVKAAVGQSP